MIVGLLEERVHKRGRVIEFWTGYRHFAIVLRIGVRLLHVGFVCSPNGPEDSVPIQTWQEGHALLSASLETPRWFCSHVGGIYFEDHSSFRWQ